MGLYGMSKGYIISVLTGNYKKSNIMELMIIYVEF